MRLQRNLQDLRADFHFGYVLCFAASQMFSSKSLYIG